MEEIIYGYGGKKYTVGKLKDLCPSRSVIEVQNKIERETHRLKIYHSERYNSQVENLPGEIWVRLSQKGWERIFVSNQARIKYLKDDGNFEFLNQDEDPSISDFGYLVIDPEKKYPELHKLISKGYPRYPRVYKLVAMAFLGKNEYEGDGSVIHHIDNNGYDNRPENLVILSNAQHLNQVHHD